MPYKDDGAHASRDVADGGTVNVKGAQPGVAAPREAKTKATATSNGGVKTPTLWGAMVGHPQRQLPRQGQAARIPG